MMDDTGSSLPRWSGAWAELLACDERRVLLVEHRASRARQRLAERASVVGVVDGVEDGGLWDGPTADRVVRASLDRHLASQWDLVVVEGPTRAHAPSELGEAVASGGRLVYVAGNRFSPIRREPATARASWARLARDLRGAGWEIGQRFGLFRSAAVATTAFDLDAPEATQAVLAAALVHLTGRRAAGVQVLRRVPAAIRVHLVPAWLVVASRAGEVTKTAPARTASAAAPDGSDLPITGRMGYERTPDSKILLGEPPRAMERTYADQRGDDAEAMALAEIGSSTPGMAPPLLARPRPGTLRIGWLDAKGLDVRHMPGDDLVRWTTTAAELLRRIQEATAQPDGSVLVHGDYWLGNLLVDPSGKEWIIDWGDARRGSPKVDRAFLASSLDGFRELSADLRDRIQRCIDEVFAGFDDPRARP